MHRIETEIDEVVSDSKDVDRKQLDKLEFIQSVSNICISGHALTSPTPILHLHVYIRVGHALTSPTDLLYIR